MSTQEQEQKEETIITYVASDLEGTISNGRIWEGIRDYLIQQGNESAYQRYVRRKFPKVLLYRLGLINSQSFKEEWMAGMLKLLAGFDTEEMAGLGQYVARECLWPRRRQDVVDELLAHQQAGHSLVVATGMFQPLLDQFLPLIGEVMGIGTPLAVENGRFTGELAGAFNVGQAKASRLGQVVSEGLLISAYGDTEADMTMLGMSRDPVAVYPDKALRQAAVERGWRIIDGEEEVGR